MFGFKSDIKKEKFHFVWNGNKVKLTIYHENRKNSRVSLTQSGVHIRLPILLPEFEKKRLVDQFVEWAKQRLDEKPHFHYDRYKAYHHGDQLQLFDQTYLIKISPTTGRSQVRIKGEIIALHLEEIQDKEVYEKTVSQMIYKALAKKYKPLVWEWLSALNEKHHFGDLKSLRMKNNSTNWGSCSNRGNINISIRLLLAPKDVVEYVLIHELAHLQHQNHGPKFWKKVEQACPNYKAHEAWLKENAKNCVI